MSTSVPVGAVAADVPQPGGAAAAVAIAGLASAAFATFVAFGSPGGRYAADWLVVDAATRLFLVLIDGIFLGIGVHLWARSRAEGYPHDLPRGAAPLILAFVAAANVAVLSNHFLGAWIAVEATTMAAAPLVAAGRSRLASWRYFLFSSVGLALALLGFLCIARGAEGHGELFFHDWLADPGPATPWRTLGVALVLLGYGTKLGLAPMYMWLPETYEEAPPAVAALLAAVQFNVALLALIRVLQVFHDVEAQVVTLELVGMGLASVGLATASLIATTRLRRLIAYASIAHGGVIAIGLGVGGAAAYGVLLYAASNAFIKAILFVTAGNIEHQYGTKETGEIRGVLKRMPYSGAFLMVGTFALLGFPPFGSFLGELLVLSGLVRSGFLFTFAALAFLVSAMFVATGRTVFPMIWGQPAHTAEGARQSLLAGLPAAGFLVALVVLGLHLPAPVNALFQDVASSLGAR